MKLTHTPSVLGVYKKNLRKTSFVETHLERRRSKMGLGMELPTGFSINPLLASVDEATPLQAQESLESDFGTGLGHHQQLFGASGDAEGGDGGEAAFALLEHQLIEEEEGYAVDEEQPLKMLSSDHHGGKGFMGGYQHQTKLRLDINDL